MRVVLVCTMFMFLALAAFIWIRGGRVQLHTKKGIIIVLLLILGGAAAAARHLTSNKPLVEEKSSSQGGLVVQATPAGFERDLKNETFEGDLQKGEEESSEEAKDYFYAGERASKSSKFQDAIRNYQNSIEARPTPSAYMNLGYCFMNILYFKDAESSFQKGLILAQKRKDDVLTSFFLANIGTVNINMGNLENAQKYYESMLPLLSRNDEAQIFYIDGVSRINLFRGKVEIALQGFKEKLRIAKLIKHNVITQAFTLATIGDIYHNQYKNNDALDALRKAETLAVGSNDLSLLATIKGVKSRVYISLGRLSEALVLLQDEVDLSKRSGDNMSYLNAITKMASFYLLQKKLDQAWQYLEEMWKITKDTDFFEGKTRSLFSMCIFYALKKQTDEIIYKCGESLQLAQQGGISNVQISSLLFMSYGYALQGSIETLKFFRDARELVDQSDDMTTRYLVIVMGGVIISEILNNITTAFLETSETFMNIVVVEKTIEWFNIKISKMWQIIKTGI